MKLDRRKLFRIASVVLLVVLVCASTMALADVGNQNRYTESSSSSSSSGDDDGLAGFIAGILVSLIFDHPVVGVPLAIIAVIIYLIFRKKGGNNGGGTPTSGNAEQMRAAAMERAQADAANESMVAAQIQSIDEHFSADKFNAWVREVFLKLQQAWTDRDWKKIRPFESEELFAQHNQQLDEYIRNNKINVIEKIGIKSCKLVSFAEDGDKEVVKVYLSAVMRDYVVDATSRKVLESDPNKDWYMNYILTFNRKKGVKTQEGLSNMSTTNCPNCGAPTQITSAGQCEYCGSVITTGEHDWVLTDLHSI